MPSLLLHPEYRLWQPDDINVLAAKLTELGLLHEYHLAAESHVYQVGDKFLQLVTFLGCSPDVALRPDDARPGQEICRVAFTLSDDLVFLASNPLPQARCSKCRAAVKIGEQTDCDSLVRCERCGTVLRLDQVDWRKAAGYVRFFVEVTGVFPHEAVPSDRLLDELAAYSKCPWAYFYLNNHSCAR